VSSAYSLKIGDVIARWSQVVTSKINLRNRRGGRGSVLLHPVGLDLTFLRPTRPNAAQGFHVLRRTSAATQKARAAADRFA